MDYELQGKVKKTNMLTMEISIIALTIDEIWP